MKYIITGSLGHISKPVVQALVATGHTVTVISSSDAKKAEIEKLGAQAAIGSVSDKVFLKSTFAGADAVYLMIPPNFVTPNFNAYQKEVANNYVYAISESGVKNVVQLSSIGAHLRKGAGPIDGLAYLEEQLGKLSGVNVKMLRPGYFYYNLTGMIGMIKQADIMGSNFGNSGQKLTLVHPSDIAAAVSKHLLALDFKGHSVTYVVGDVRSADEIAGVLSKAIDKTTPWVTFSDADALQGMLQGGLQHELANGYIEMGRAFGAGIAQEDYVRQGAPVNGKVKLEDFAQEFKAAYEKV